MTDPLEQARERYEGAVERHAAIRAQWEAEGRPLTHKGYRGADTEHPLVRLLRLHEKLLIDLERPLRRRHSGPEPSAVIKASIGESPSARLRVLGGSRKGRRV